MSLNYHLLPFKAQFLIIYSTNFSEAHLNYFEDFVQSHLN